MIETNILKLTKSNTVYNVDSVRLNNNEVSSIIINNNYKWTSAPKDTRIGSLLGQDRIGLYGTTTDIRIEPDSTVNDSSYMDWVQRISYNTSDTDIYYGSTKSLYKGPMMLLYEFGGRINLSDEPTLSHESGNVNVANINDLRTYKIDNYGIGIISNIFKFSNILNDLEESDIGLYCGSKIGDITIVGTPYMTNNNNGCPFIGWTKGYTHKNIRIPARFYGSNNYSTGYDMLCLYSWVNDISNGIESYCYNNSRTFTVNSFDKANAIYLNKYNKENDLWTNTRVDDYENNNPGIYSSSQTFLFLLSNIQTDLYDYRKEQIVDDIKGIKFIWMINTPNNSSKYKTWHFNFIRYSSISILQEYYSPNRVYIFDNSNNSFSFSKNLQTPSTKFLTEWLLPNEIKVLNNESLTNSERYLFVFQLGSSYILNSGQIDVPANSIIAIPKGLVNPDGSGWNSYTSLDDYLSYESYDEYITDYLNDISNIQVQNTNAELISRVLWGTLVYNVYYISNSTKIIKS